jgi:hypothetical protein
LNHHQRVLLDSGGEFFSWSGKINKIIVLENK